MVALYDDLPLLEPEGDVEGGLVRADSNLRNELMGTADGHILLDKVFLFYFDCLQRQFDNVMIFS